MNVNELFESQLNEARKPTLTYTEKQVKGKVERLIVTLAGNESAAMTKLGKQYKEMQKRLERVTAVKEELNGRIKSEIVDLYDAEDEVLTRVVETVSITATLAKKGTDGPKVDHEKVVAKLLTLMPELQAKIDELTKEFTSVVKAKEPGLTVKVTEDVAGVWKALKDKFSKLLSSFKTWGKSFDQKLAEIKSAI